MLHHLVVPSLDILVNCGLPMKGNVDKTGLSFLIQIQNRLRGIVCVYCIIVHASEHLYIWWKVFFLNPLIDSTSVSALGSRLARKKYSPFNNLLGVSLSASSISQLILCHEMCRNIGFYSNWPPSNTLVSLLVSGLIHRGVRSRTWKLVTNFCDLLSPTANTIYFYNVGLMLATICDAAPALRRYWSTASCFGAGMLLSGKRLPPFSTVVTQ